MSVSLIYSLDLTEINRALRDINATLAPLEAGFITLRGGRVTNAGEPIEPFDYVRLYDVEKKLEEVRGDIRRLNARLDRMIEDLPATFRDPYR